MKDQLLALAICRGPALERPGLDGAQGIAIALLIRESRSLEQRVLCSKIGAGLRPAPTERNEQKEDQGNKPFHPFQPELYSLPRRALTSRSAATPAACAGRRSPTAR